MELWTKRKFWDGSEAIFMRHKGVMSCFDLDSDQLGDIIQTEVDKRTSEIGELLELKKLRMEYTNGKESD
tara:strand:- start:38 stop:247 length:210 start_codon:yes stop_codon:yes gene_type:complete